MSEKLLDLDALEAIGLVYGNDVARIKGTQLVAIVDRIRELESASQPGGGEAVAIVGDVFQLLWVGSGPITEIVKRHGIKVGSKLYAHPAQHGEGDAA